MLHLVLVQTLTNTQAPTCRRLQPPLVLQHPLEGSYNPLISFIDSYWKEAPTPSLKDPTLNTLWAMFKNVSQWIHLSQIHIKTCRPPFIKLSHSNHTQHYAQSQLTTLKPNTGSNHPITEHTKNHIILNHHNHIYQCITTHQYTKT